MMGELTKRSVIGIDLRPEPNEVRVRPKELGVGLGMLAASVGLALFAISGRGMAPPRDDKTSLWLSLAAACLIVGLAILSKTFRKIEFTQFVSNHGRPLLDVARAGPERASFDSFVETLIGQIRASQRIDS